MERSSFKYVVEGSLAAMSIILLQEEHNESRDDKISSGSYLLFVENVVDDFFSN